MKKNTIRYCLLLLLLIITVEKGSAQTALFPLNDVRLLPSRFQDNFKRDSAWMMSIPVPSLLHSFQTTAGAYAGKEGGYMTVKKLGGWESMDCDLRGHITGHLLSALATLYAQTGSAAVKAKADSIVNGLNEVQHAYGNTGYLSAFGEGLIDRNIQGKSVWAPWYTLHKILQGLIDQYTLCGNDTALAIAKRMGLWAYNKTKDLSEETRKRMLRNEFGGFNDAMYQLYGLTKDERYLKTARFFYDAAKIDPLKQGNDNLGTNHANTFIPKLIGEARNYEFRLNSLSTGGGKIGTSHIRSGSLPTGEGWGEASAASLLFNTLAFKHAFVTGEVSDKEHLFDPQKQSKHLSAYDGENCCTFNLLKLATHVYSWNIQDAAKREQIVAYSERALYNHILGQQDPQTSMVCYFTPLQSGAYRLFSTRDSSYWCCVGSGFESHVSYAHYIYGHDGDHDLFVNLLIPSRLSWQGTTMTQTTDFPQSGTTTLTFTNRPRRFNVHLRRPAWATSITVKINGKKAKDIVWQKDDIIIPPMLSASSKHSATKEGKESIEVTYGMALHEEATKDDPNRFAVLYGPIVLSGKLQTVDHPFSDSKKYNDYYTYNYNIPSTVAKDGQLDGIKSLKKIGPLEYVTSNGIRLHPFYDAHHERYVVYWQR